MVAREAIGSDKATLCLPPSCRLAAAITASVNALLQTSTEDFKFETKTYESYKTLTKDLQNTYKRLTKDLQKTYKT